VFNKTTVDNLKKLLITVEITKMATVVKSKNQEYSG